MGVRTRKKPSPKQPPVRKPEVGSEAPGAQPQGCPEAVTVQGSGEGIAVGQRAVLTIAGDHGQLVVANRVRPISTMSQRSLVTRCLEQGASYIGRVSKVSGERFEASLRLGGDR